MSERSHTILTVTMWQYQGSAVGLEGLKGIKLIQIGLDDSSPKEYHAQDFMYMLLPSRRRRLAFILLAIGLLAILTRGYLLLEDMKERLIVSAGESMAQLAVEITDKLDLALFQAYGDIQMMARDFVGGDSGALTEQLARIQSAHPIYRWIAVTNEAGQIVASTEVAEIGGDQSRSQWFETVRVRAGLTIQAVWPSGGQDEIFTIAFTAPLQGGNGALRGAVASRIGLPILTETINRKVQAFGGMRPPVQLGYQLITNAGDVIFDSVFGPEADVNQQERALPAVLLGRESDGPGYIVERNLQQVPVIIGYARTQTRSDFPGIRWGVLVQMKRSDALAPLAPLYWKLAIAGLLIVLSSLIVLWWSRKRRRDDPHISEKEEWYSNVLTSLGHGVIVADAGGLIAFMNPVAEFITGWSHKEAAGRPLKEVFTLINKQTGYPVDPPISPCPHESRLSPDRQILRAKDGVEKRLDLIGVRNEKVLGMVLSFRDLSAGEREEEERLSLSLQDLKRRLKNI